MVKKILVQNTMQQLIKNIRDMHAHSGEAWLKKLPNIIDELAKAWNLTEIMPFDNLTFNFVASVIHQDQPAVLKISFNKLGFLEEINALRFFNTGTPNILAVDEDHLAVLLERAVPGTTLKTFSQAHKDHSIIKRPLHTID